MISTITAYLNSITHAISNPSKAISSIATRLDALVRAIFPEEKCKQIEDCKECKGVKMILCQEGGKATLVRSFISTYSTGKKYPAENLANPGCFLQVHDRKICLFALQILKETMRARALFCQLCEDLEITAEDSSFTIKIPEIQNKQAQILHVEKGSTKIFKKAIPFSSLCALFFSMFSLYAHEPYSESLHSHWTQSFEVSEVLYQEQSDFWDLILFENSHFGKVLAIDGVIQLTEADEPFYSEMMAHVPLLTHGNASSVLIIGGGDGCILREVLKHPVKQVTLVEIDRKVIEIAQNYFAEQIDGAFDDPRVEIVIQDAAEYVKTAPHSFDVIICDSTDPVGPAQVLFSKGFYADCKTLLNCGGIFVNQNGAPFVQMEELHESLKNRKDLFRVATFYTTAVPTYIGGFMTLGWSSDEAYEISREVLESRFEFLKGKTKYYNPAIHKAAFALPEYVLR